ncbi:MAG: hypothetical protein ACE141_14375 [Bryobacteraceae bacterium]
MRMRPAERKRRPRRKATKVLLLPFRGEVPFPAVEDISRRTGIPLRVLRRRVDAAVEAGVLRRVRVDEDLFRGAA